MWDQASCVRLECQQRAEQADNDQRVIFTVLIAQYTALHWADLDALTPLKPGGILESW